MRNRAPAYWISPSGSAVPIGGVFQRHIELVIAQPERFGLQPLFCRALLLGSLQSEMDRIENLMFLKGKFRTLRELAGYSPEELKSFFD
jgi:hypothetical protein